MKIPRTLTNITCLRFISFSIKLTVALPTDIPRKTKEEISNVNYAVDICLPNALHLLARNEDCG